MDADAFLPCSALYIHTLHLILSCTTLAGVSSRPTQAPVAPPPPCSSREAWACSPRKSGPQSSSVCSHNQYGNGFIPLPFLFITCACPPPPSTPPASSPSSPRLPPRVSGYLNMSSALRGGGLAIKPHGAERWTIKPFESIKAKQHHFLASWHFYGRLGRGGEGRAAPNAPTAQLQTE